MKLSLNFFSKKQKSNQINEKETFNKEGILSSKEIINQELAYKSSLFKVLDLIAPSALEVSSSHLQLGEVFCRTIFAAAYPKALNVGWMNYVIGIDFPMDIAMFIHPYDTNKVLKQLRKQATRIQSQINIESEKGLVRDPALEMAYYNVESLRDQLQQGLERFFKFGLYFTIYASDLDELDKRTELLEATLNARSVYTKKAIFRMKDGFVSSLPLGKDALGDTTALNTSPLSTTFPFISADVTSNQGVMYGINIHNSSLVLFDRFSMENANMVIFAKSGAGKSYAVKLEILRSLMLGTETIVIDPEDEYRYLAEAVGGSYIKMSLNSENHINPFDLPREKEKTTDQLLRSNISSLLGLFKIMLGTITPEEDSILEQAIRETYAIRDITSETPVEELEKRSMPLLADLHQVLKNMEGAEDLAIRLEKYTTGIFSGILNDFSNVSLNNKLIIFNIRDLEDELRPIAMYLILNFIWNEVRTNIKKRYIVIDEAWVMMKYEEAAQFVFSVAKRIRKYYGGLTTITQDISDFMASKYGKPIISNSSIQLLMRQSQSSIDVVADTFYLTDREKYILLDCNVGEGIFFAGLKRAAIRVVASYNEDKIITTNPAQRLEIEKEKEEGNF